MKLIVLPGILVHLEKIPCLSSDSMPQRLPPPTPRDVRKVCTDYHRSFGRFPNLLRPRSFSEKIQWRKLFDLNPIYTILADKIAAREFIASRVGAEWLAPLLWAGDSPDQIPFDELKPPYVLKCTHGSGFNVIVTDAATLDRERTRETLRAYLCRDYGSFIREPGYILIRPRLLAERLMLEANGQPPLERRVHVFDGHAPVIWTVFVNAERARFSAFHTRDWTRLPWRYINKRLHTGADPHPEQLNKFLELAEAIGAGFDHIRVDFYEWNTRPVVGELTLCTHSGLEPFEPDSADIFLGSHWKLRHPIGRAVTPLGLGAAKAVRSVGRRAVAYLRANGSV